MNQVLLLNMGYQPIAAVSRRKSMDLVYFRNKAEAIAHYADGRPAVIKLVVKSPDPWKWMRLLESARYIKSVIFERDDYMCVYCGYRSVSKKNLSIDHVLPRSRGGPSTYANCVTACKPCNHYKDNLTPDEAGMRILYQQKVKKVGGIFIKSIPPEWDAFLR
jgi:hypothetical protein